jgi:ubiquinone/menaquinone biosynthesis C-methylase UbiE
MNSTAEVQTSGKPEQTLSKNMKVETAFDNNVLEYDHWYEENSGVYQSELLAIKQAIPENKKGLEIGTGTGRFSTPFNIHIGVEPSANMAKLAEERGITIVKAVAESLPFHDASFDFVLMVTTDCFLSDIPRAFVEAKRILKQNGSIIIGFVDKESRIGKIYEQMKSTNKFYKDAHFHTAVEITEALEKAEFNSFSYWQTIFSMEMTNAEQPIKGFGTGSFVVIKALKQ